MERRISYFEVFGHFMEIAGVAVTIIGVNLNFPLNWILGIAGVGITLLGLVLDILSVNLNNKEIRQKVSSKDVEEQFAEDVVEYAYSVKLFPLLDSFDGKTLKLIHQDVKNQKVYDVISPLEFPETQHKNDAHYKAALERAKEQIDGFIKMNPNLKLEDMGND